MGNRAVITDKERTVGVYVHWNGGIDSVTAFLKYADLRGIRAFPDPYAPARLTQIIANYFGGTLSIGITNEPESWAEGADNGMYVIDGWKIVEHWEWNYLRDDNGKLMKDDDGNYITEKVNVLGNEYHEGYDIMEMLHDIDEAQPIKEQLGKDFIESEEIDASELKVGDEVCLCDPVTQQSGTYTVVGIAPKDYWCNGFKGGLPYINKYCKEDPKENPNNYLCGTVRRKRNING